MKVCSDLLCCLFFICNTISCVINTLFGQLLIWVHLKFRFNDILYLAMLYGAIKNYSENIIQKYQNTIIGNYFWMIEYFVLTTWKVDTNFNNINIYWIFYVEILFPHTCIYTFCNHWYWQFILDRRCEKEKWWQLVQMYFINFTIAA